MYVILVGCASSTGAAAEFMRRSQIFGAGSSDAVSADNGKIAGNCLHNGIW